MRSYFRTSPWLILFALPLISACQEKKAETSSETSMGAQAPAPAPAAVTTIELGRGVGADKRVLAPLDAFTAKDTIFASVTTENAAPGSMLTAVWTHESGQTVDSTAQPLASGAPSITEFHIAKPSGWPKGNYKVVLLLDGQSAGEKAFVVK